LLLGAEPEKQFDLVVSDVMMPEMDGFTLLRMIKTNMNINHTPVVMLTSKAAVANRLEGLEKGADAFLAKPFDMDELHMVINNLISKNLRLKGKFSGSQQQKDKVEEKQVKGNDEVLMERIMKVVNEHLDDSDFNVEMLTKEVGISRAQLHRRMKEMTGAKEAFEWLAEHFDVYILSTAPWGNPSAWTDKLNWVKTHLGEPARKRLILSHQKDLLRGDYIIDDSTKNGVAEFQGKHIQIGTEPCKDWPAVIDFFKGELKSLT
jgi:CheY-like chemotaxis protein